MQLLTGRDFWNTWPIEKIGLRRILVSDGPSGVRGEVWDERSPSLNLPSATALGSAWDPALARRYGAAAAVEARRKGVDVVLGPTINLHRSPLGGRHFEAFSEDPVLTAELAAAYVDGVQENGVGATPKHYIANDSETDRFTVDVQVAERPLRELYLLAFEKAIVDAHAWLVMSAYNSINGVTATENDLLETPLNSEWGFDGVVISDWTAVRSLDSATRLPGSRHARPGRARGVTRWSPRCAPASVAESDVDRKVLRILQLAARVGALDGFEPVAAEPIEVEDGIAFVREAAAAGTVLLTNRGELPWSATALGSGRGHRPQRRPRPHPGRRKRHGAPRAGRLAARRHPRRAARSIRLVRDRRGRAGGHRAVPARSAHQPGDGRAGHPRQLPRRRRRRAVRRGPPRDVAGLVRRGCADRRVRHAPPRNALRRPT